MVRFYHIAGWLTLLVLAFFTLSPLDVRPEIATPQIERFAAFVLLGFAFALAYPRRLTLAFLIVVGSAASLETLQLLTPDRHARLIDAAIKMSGGICGIIIGWLMTRLSLAKMPLSR